MKRRESADPHVRVLRPTVKSADSYITSPFHHDTDVMYVDFAQRLQLVFCTRCERVQGSVQLQIRPGQVVQTHSFTFTYPNCKNVILISECQIYNRQMAFIVSISNCQKFDSYQQVYNDTKTSFKVKWLRTQVMYRISLTYIISGRDSLA